MISSRSKSPGPPLIGVVHQGTKKVLDYVACVTAAGGFAEIIHWQDVADPERDVAHFDGLVLSGGDDIRAKYFGQEDHPKITLEPEVRDEYELALCRLAVDQDVPLLAICRGMQALNVALGGDIEQHIPDVPGRGDHEAGVLHEVRLGDDSELERLLEASTATVNSFHHQAVGRVPHALRATAWAPDGAVEAIEAHPGDARYLVGVQWHPERRGNPPPLAAGLFEALIRACEA